MMHSVRVKAPGKLRDRTYGINRPLTRAVLGWKIVTIAEGRAATNISKSSMLLVLKKYSLPRKMQMHARIVMKSVFMM